MADYFDAVRWREVIQRPDWYVRLGDEIAELRRRAETDPDGDAIKRAARQVFYAYHFVTLAEEG